MQVSNPAPVYIEQEELAAGGKERPRGRDSSWGQWCRSSRARWPFQEGTEDRSRKKWPMMLVAKWESTAMHLPRPPQLGKLPALPVGPLPRTHSGLARPCKGTKLTLLRRLRQQELPPLIDEKSVLSK